MILNNAAKPGKSSWVGRTTEMWSVWYQQGGVMAAAASPAL